MKTIAYLRVSRDSQDVKNQRLAILEFAQKEKMEVDSFIEITVSSRKSTKERKIDDGSYCADCGKQIDRIWEMDHKTGDRLCIDCLVDRVDSEYDEKMVK